MLILPFLFKIPTGRAIGVGSLVGILVLFWLPYLGWKSMVRLYLEVPPVTQTNSAVCLSSWPGHSQNANVTRFV